MKTIITILFAFVAMAGQAKKTIVWENPAIGYSDKPYFQIQNRLRKKSQHFQLLVLEETYSYKSLNIH